MNKQEALEALLVECRRYEESGREVREWPEAEIQKALLGQAQDLDVIISRMQSGGPFGRGELVRAEAQYRQRLVRVAGAALSLLIDEVTVVEVALPPAASSPQISSPEPVNGRMLGWEPRRA